MKSILLRIKKRLGVARAFNKELRQWHRLKSRIEPCKADRRHLVIVPCDPGSVGGSRGDEAMIMGVINKYRSKFPQIPVSIVCSDEKGISYVTQFPIGVVQSIASWNGNYPLERIYTSIINAHPSDVVILGADCMDGYYSPLISLTLLALHDLSASTPGISSCLLGFSFNAKPYRLLKYAYNRLGGNVIINLRDRVSLSRFTRFTSKKAGLVADAAFMLQPNYDFEGYDRLEEWVKDKRRNGSQIVMGMNFHPMLRSYSGKDDIISDALIIAKNVARILRERTDIVFVFIPHDDRSQLTDNLMLGEMYKYLSDCGLDDRVYYEQHVYRADQLKGLCRLLDGIVSSRMHLAIAALGQGKSVMAASYQGKFEGLFDHFNIPHKYILSANKFISSEMVDCFGDYVSNLEALNTVVARSLPNVIQLSENNINNNQ